MHKKGQFYIFLALILLAYVASIRPTLDTVDQTRVAYSAAQENFLTESHMVINNAIYSDEDVVDQLDTFVDAYVGYQESQGINVSIIYILKHDGNMYLRNEYRDSKVIVDDTTYDLGKSAILTLNATSEISINASDYEYYTFDFSDTKPVDYKAVFRVK